MQKFVTKTMFLAVMTIKLKLGKPKTNNLVLLSSNYSTHGPQVNNNNKCDSM